MKLITNLCITILLFLFSGNLNAQIETEKTKVLILGTHHLNQIKNFQSKMLDNLIIKLDSFKFDAVCIENMPGELLYDIKSRNDSAYINVIESFGGNRLNMAELAQKKLGIGFLEAQQNILGLLEKDTLSDVEHLLLVEYFTTATDIASATLHYQYIQDKSILEKSRLPKQVLKTIDENLNNSDEIYSLALKIANNQMLERIEYIDNFQDEALLLKHFSSFIQDYKSNQELFKDIVNNSPVYIKINELIKRGVEKNDILDLYTFLNSEEYMKQDFEAQWAIWFTTNFPSGSDRARYSLWEMRNLQIAANILETAAFYPGKRILVIIGSSHKSFLEKYLRQVPDIELLGFK